MRPLEQVDEACMTMHYSPRGRSPIYKGLNYFSKSIRAQLVFRGHNTELVTFQVNWALSPRNIGLLKPSQEFEDRFSRQALLLLSADGCRPVTLLGAIVAELRVVATSDLHERCVRG